jgi:cytochrome b
VTRSPGGRRRRVFVWDAPTRLFHWGVAALVTAAYLTWRLDWMDWHERAGDAVLALVLFRILWGFFGSDTARFARFLAAPRAAARHLACAFRREPDACAGHNPAGGWMVLLLLLLLLAESLSGLYVANDVADEGPFTERLPASVSNAITTLHSLLWDALLAGVVLHLLAIAVYAIAKGQNLLLPMISGWKTLPQALPPPHMAGRARAAALLGLSALATAALVRYL